MLVKSLGLEPMAPGTGEAFADTVGHWAEWYIATASARQLVQGYGENTFGPDDHIAREQMASMVARALNLVAPVAFDLADLFSDHSSVSDWAAVPVAAAVEAGVMKGYEDGTFRPAATATRAEAATVLLRALPGLGSHE